MSLFNITKDILFLAPANSTPAYKKVVDQSMSRVSMSPMNVNYMSTPAGWLKKKTKNTYTWDESKRPVFDALLKDKPYKLIIVNDKAALGFVTSKYTSLACCRGSVFYYKGICCIVMDDLKKLRFVNWFGWVALMDWQKAMRFYTGKPKQEPMFSLTVCKTLADVEQIRIKIKTAILTAIDIETSSVYISSIAYTMLRGKKVETYVVPIIYTAGQNESNAYWKACDEEVVWGILRDVNLDPSPKGWQNGIYDNAYMVKYRMPVKNYFIDPMHLMHSIWTEAPKRLDFITSLFVDHYRYWKDEGKEDEKDDKDKSKLPSTVHGYKHYWIYNGLDTYFTLLSMIALVKIISSPKLEWARNNYATEISLQSGPMLLMSLRGMHCDIDIRNELGGRWLKASDDARKDLHIMVGDEEFNPNSTDQVATLIYDILRAVPVPRAKKRTTGEPELKLIQTQHPVLERVIDQIWAVKKPKNNYSKYGNIRLLNSRLMYQISASGTDTGRLASRAGQFWIGTNAQNIPKDARCMLEPDRGYILFDIDYAQSDAYFTAFSSQDPTFMKIMLDDRDTHCFHAAHFFKKTYEAIYEGHINDEDWVTHPVYGVRQLTKRLVYGLNYLMSAHTLFITMGKKAVISAGHALGFTDAHAWPDKKLVNLCQHFSDEYFKLYPWLLTSLESEIRMARNTGNKFACAFGRTRLFLADLKDKKAQREFAAYIGQGGTAGNINKALMNIWNQGLERKYNFEVLVQVHDSVVGQVREDSLHNIPLIQKALENTVSLKGREFVVPTDAQVGLGWGKRLMGYRPDLTLDEIQTYDNNWTRKFYGN